MHTTLIHQLLSSTLAELHANQLYFFRKKGDFFFLHREPFPLLGYVKALKGITHTKFHISNTNRTRDSDAFSLKTTAFSFASSGSFHLEPQTLRSPHLWMCPHKSKRQFSSPQAKCFLQSLSKVRGLSANATNGYPSFQNHAPASGKLFLDVLGLH